MSHAIEVEKAEERDKILKKYEEEHPEQHIVAQNVPEKSWSQIFKELVMKPYPYVVAVLLTISPYGVDIINALLTFFSNR
jgi:hypothetical protein